MRTIIGCIDNNFMHLMNFLRLIIAVFALFAIDSCYGNKQVTYDYPNNIEVTRRARSGNFMSKAWLPFAKKDEKKIAEVIESPAPEKDSALSLWQASVESIGEMFPISVMDKSSGIIATEWYQETPESTTRLKINVLVRGKKDDTQDSLRVSVFQQKRVDSNSPWQGSGLENSESVADSALKARKIKEYILNKINRAKKSSSLNE